MAITPVFLRTQWNYDRDAASEEAGLNCPPTENMAQQQFKEECDINTIVERFGLTGQMPQSLKLPQYGDFTGIQDYKTALDAINEARTEFYKIPAELRERFRNDPQLLLEFLGDEKNREEAIKLGLLEKPAEVTRPASVPQAPQ